MTSWKIKKSIDVEQLTEEEILAILEDSDSELEEDEIEEDEIESIEETIVRHQENNFVIEENIENIEPIALHDAGNVNGKKQKSKTKFNHKWSSKDINPVDDMFQNTFSDPPPETMTPLEYFRLFIDQPIIENLVYQTNLYSVQKSGKNIDTNVNEMEQFLGIHILSGIVRVPQYRMYWARESRYNTIADTMSRNRFDKLRSYFHVNDNSTAAERGNVLYDKLHKVRPFITSIQKNLNNIEAEEYNSIDEFIIPFKGRSSLKQYIKNKPHKWGIKVFGRAGSSGIIYAFEIYIGKGTVIIESELGISGDIVLRLIEDLENHQNYKIFTDNWFTSYALLSKLKEKGFHASGTVRINRMPGCILEGDKSLSNRGRGSYDVKTEENQNISVVKWYDNKYVHVASTNKGLQPIDYVKRWCAKEKKYIEVPRPAAIKGYNQNMGGVDLHDMLVELYRIDIRPKRYYIRIIFHLIDMCIVNAWLIYRRHCRQKNVKHITLLNFRAQIGHGLLKANKTIKRKRGRPSEETVVVKKEVPLLLQTMFDTIT